MIGRRGLSRQIFLSMAIVTVVAAVVVFVGLYIAFAVIFTFFPTLIDYEEWLPSSTELLIFLLLIVPSLIVASAVALKLANRILAPLNSIAESARRIAAGDLTARALPGDRTLGETAHLVSDFNAMAQRLQDMADEMAAWNAAIAHELRTPLTILRGTLQGIADGVFTPDEQRIRTLLLQIEGLSRLVDDLRVVTLAETRRLDLQIETVAVATEIQRVLDLTGPALAEASLTVELTTFDIAIEADGMRIRQALLALIENARRYAGPGRLEITMLALDENIVIRVEDEGPGLEPDFAKRAFETFSRGEASRSRRSGGSGLGLSVVRAIAEAHGGTVSYRRSARGGAAFDLVLPRSRSR